MTGVADLRDLERLDHLDPDPSTRLTVVRVGRPTVEADQGWMGDGWGESIRLAPLTRTETGIYVADRLKAAGRFEPLFTPRAIARLHANSGGNPRGIHRIAGRALMASALRKCEMVPPELVDQAADDGPSTRRSDAVGVAL